MIKVLENVRGANLYTPCMASIVEYGISSTLLLVLSKDTSSTLLHFEDSSLNHTNTTVWSLLITHGNHIYYIHLVYDVIT